MRKFYAIALILLFASLTAPTVAASFSASATVSENEKTVHSYARFYDEPTPGITTAEILSSPQLFTPHRSTSLATAVHWVRLPVADTAGRGGRLVLDLGIPDAILLDAYKVTGGKAVPLMSLAKGAPFHDRPLPGRMLAIPFELAPGESGELAIRYSTHANTPLTLALLTPEQFLDELADGNLVNGMIMGLLAALALLALLQYMASRHAPLLIYMVLALMMMAFMSQFEGYNFAYFWPDHGDWNNRAPIFMALGMQMLHALFTMTIFEMHGRSWLRRAYLGYILLLLLSTPLYLAQGWWLPAMAVIFLYGPLSVAAGVFFLRRGNMVAAYFLAATVFYVLCNNVLFGLTVFGLGPNVSPFLYPRIGYVAEALLFALALAHQTQSLRHQVEDTLRLRLAEARQLANAEAEKNQALMAAHRQQMQLAAAGHDMAQPLSSIRFAVTALRMQSGNETVTRHIDQALGYTESLLRGLIADARQGHAELRGEVALDTLMASVVERLRPVAEGKGLRLRLCPTTSRITALEDVLTRIVENLAGNAVRYTQRGTVLLGVRHRARGVEIQVADTGPGFDTRRRKELLAPFAQGDGLASERLGHGLGLHIVRTLCEQTGYELTIRSVPDRGSVFGVLIPRESQ